MEERVATSIKPTEVAKQIRVRFRDGKENGAFIGTFALGVVFFSAAGIWLEVFRQDMQNYSEYLPATIFTYGLALLAAIAIDLILGDPPEFDSSEYIGRKARIIFGYLFGVIAIVLMVLGFYFETLLLSCFGLLISWFLWFVYYEDDEKFTDKVNPETLLGSKDFAGGGL